MSMQYFIISVYSGCENEVAEAFRKLETEDPDNFGDVFVPMKNGELAFPGYVFAVVNLFENYADFIKNNDVQNKVNSIKSVIGFLGGERPRPLSEEEIISLMKFYSNDEKKEKPVELNVGDAVKILDGAFANFTGTIKEIDNDEYVVNVTIYGEENTVTIPKSTDIEKVD